MPAPEELRVRAHDGHELAATLHAAPAAPAARVLVGGAMGVPRRYYDPFASFLAEAGLETLTLDYRGVGGSRPERLRGFPCALHDWAELDLRGALDGLAARGPGPILFVGHSLGGQILGMVPGVERVAAALTVAAQSGYWGHWPGLGKLTMLFTWYVLIPLATRVLGVTPLRVAGGEDVPAGVGLEWARWGRDPRYLLPTAEARGHDFARFQGPWRAYALADDPYAPPRTVEALLGYYPRARGELVVVRPADVGAPRIGHFGFFRAAFRDTLWGEARAWLVSQVAGRGAGGHR